MKYAAAAYMGAIALAVLPASGETATVHPEALAPCEQMPASSSGKGDAGVSLVRESVMSLVPVPPVTAHEAGGVVSAALSGDVEAIARLIACGKGCTGVSVFDKMVLKALSRARFAPERGRIAMPASAAPVFAGGFAPNSPGFGARGVSIGLTSVPEKLPSSARSSAELVQTALPGDAEAVAELAFHWMNRLRLSDIPQERRYAPWHSDALHWASHWMNVWKSGRSYGVLASRLEEGTPIGDLLDNPAWVELMAASARIAEGDAVRDALKAVDAVLPLAKGHAAESKLRSARRSGMAVLRAKARAGERGAAARYRSLVFLRGTEREKREADDLLARAAEAGDVEAIRLLAMTAKKPEEAAAWRSRAIALGDVATMRQEMEEMKASDPRAEALRRELAARGDERALMQSAESVLKLPAGEEREAKLAQAEECLLKAARQGIGRASMLLCLLYEGKYGGVPSPEKACAVAREMAIARYAPGLLKMANYKEKGYGSCSRDLSEAYALAESAAKSRMPEALVHWARLLLRGIGTKPDPVSAAYVLEYVRSVAPETPSLNFFLGYMYETGVGLKKDLGMALSFYAAGVEQGDDRAMNNLASMYEAGVGVAADRDKAIELYRRAAQLGNEDGRANYERLTSGK